MVWYANECGPAKNRNWEITKIAILGEIKVLGNRPETIVLSLVKMGAPKFNEILTPLAAQDIWIYHTFDDNLEE